MSAPPKRNAQQLPVLVALCALTLWACEGGDSGSINDGRFLVTSTCPVPRPQVVTHLHEGARLVFDSAAVEVGTSADPEARAPKTWLSQAHLDVEPGAPPLLTVFARYTDAPCTDGHVFRWTYQVVEAFSPAAGEPGCPAVGLDDPAIRAWATGYVSPVAFGSEVDDEWQTPELALGPAVGDIYDVVSLGRGGEITLTFDTPIADGEGADFAVFENGFDQTFLELAVVEVSSDGETFLTFDHISLNPASAGYFEPTAVHGLASKYVQGYGTPFDLAVFRQHRSVLDRTVDLGAIRFVRLRDVVGDGSTTDSFGNPLHDPYPTTGSAGFDLDAVGVIHTADGS